MTAAAACYTETGIAIAADSLCVNDHAEVAERKIWGLNGWVFAAAGDAALARWLRVHPLQEIRGEEGEPHEEPEAYLWRLLDHVIAGAQRYGLIRDGVQGQRFAAIDLIACHHTAGIYIIHDGQSVRRVDEVEGIVAIGDPTAVRAAFVALATSGCGRSLYTLVRAIRCVSDVSDVVGGPVRGRRCEDGAWHGEETWVP